MRSKRLVEAPFTITLRLNCLTSSPRTYRRAGANKAQLARRNTTEFKQTVKELLPRFSEMLEAELQEQYGVSETEAVFKLT